MEQQNRVQSKCQATKSVRQYDKICKEIIIYLCCVISAYLKVVFFFFNVAIILAIEQLISNKIALKKYVFVFFFL